MHDLLHVLRTEWGLSQADLAKALKVSPLFKMTIEEIFMEEPAR